MDTETQYCEFPEFESFQTAEEKEEAFYEGCSYTDRYEDEDRANEQAEDVSRWLLDALS